MRSIVVSLLVLSFGIMAQPAHAQEPARLQLRGGLAYEKTSGRNTAVEYDLRGTQKENRDNGLPGVDVMKTGSIRASYDDSQVLDDLRPVDIYSRVPLKDITIRGAVGYSLLENAELKAAHMDTYAAKIAMWRQLAGFTPVITGSVDLYRNYNLSPSSNYPAQTTTSSTGTIELSMPLFTSGRLFFGYKAAKSNFLAQHYREMSARARVAQSTAGAFLEYYYGHNSRSILQQNIRGLEKMLASVKARRSAGFASGADVAQVKANLLAYRSQVSSLERTSKDAKNKLERLVGHRVNGVARIAPLDKMTKVSLETFLEEARRRNPSLLAAGHSAQSSTFASKSVRGNLLPQLNLLGDYERNFRPQEGINPNKWSVGVKLTMPLLNLDTVAEYHQSKAQAIAARYRAQDAFHELDLSIRSTYDNYKSLGQNLNISRQENKEMKKVLKSKIEQYREGVLDITQVLNYRQEYAMAQLQTLRLRTERYSAMIRLLLESGLYDDFDQFFATSAKSGKAVFK